MVGAGAAIVKNDHYVDLIDSDKRTVNDLIEFLYHRHNQLETETVIKNALAGNELVGPFNSVSDFMRDLYADD